MWSKTISNIFCKIDAQIVPLKLSVTTNISNKATADLEFTREVDDEDLHLVTIFGTRMPPTRFVNSKITPNHTVEATSKLSGFLFEFKDKDNRQTVEAGIYAILDTGLSENDYRKLTIPSNLRWKQSTLLWL